MLATTSALAAADVVEASSSDETVTVAITDPSVANTLAVRDDVIVTDTNDAFATAEVAIDALDEIGEQALEMGAVVERDVRVAFAAITPTDPQWAAWWGARQLNLPVAWGRGLGGVDIAIIDSGVAVTSELSGKVSAGYSFIPGQPARVGARDGSDDGHGTMAATVAAGYINNGVAAGGSCPQCRIIPIRVVGQGDATASLLDVANGIVWATDNGAEVISISLAGGTPLQVLDEAVAYATSRNVVVVASAGNAGTTLKQYPAATPGVLAVAAVDNWNGLYSWSNRGGWVQAAGPGCAPALNDENVVETFCGTSSAAPAVAGVVALHKTLNPQTTNAQVLGELRDYGTVVNGMVGKLVDAGRFVEYRNWLAGPPGNNGNPLGSIDVAKHTPSGLAVAGWALDYNTLDPVDVAVTVDGGGPVVIPASANRPDVGNAYPGYGAARGFETLVSGARVCVTLYNKGPGSDTSLGCRTPNASPVGAIDAVSVGDGTVTVVGWAVDPDTGAPVPLTLTSGTTTLATGIADMPLTSSPAGYKEHGANRGYTLTGSLPGGVHTVCVTAQNTGMGVGKTLGCQSVTVPSKSPVGQVETSTHRGPNTVRVSGWVADEDATEPTSVQVRVDGTLASSSRATVARGASTQAPTGVATWGYVVDVPAAAGLRTVCVTAVNQQAGSDTSLGCRSVNVRSGVPIGAFDAAGVAGSRTVSVSGWALDYDSAAPVAVHVYVNGKFAGSGTAGRGRSDIARAYPGWGAERGYGITTAAQPGLNQVCAYAINQGPGGFNPLLGCRSVTVPTGVPVGNFEAVTRVDARTVRVGGWAVDPDVAGSVALHVYVNGRFRVAAGTTVTRADVARLWPGWDARRGFSVNVPAAPGAQVCVYAINQGPGGFNPLLGCRTAR